jgi:hypothetical protein
MRPAIEVVEDGRALRVGSETRPLEYSDHFVANWIFSGPEFTVTKVGIWRINQWGPARIAAHQKRERREVWLRRFPALRRRPAPGPRYTAVISQNIFAHAPGLSFFSSDAAGRL